MKAVVELTRATKRYGRIAALQDVSLALNPGENRRRDRPQRRWQDPR